MSLSHRDEALLGPASEPLRPSSGFALGIALSLAREPDEGIEEFEPSWVADVVLVADEKWIF